MELANRYQKNTPLQEGSAVMAASESSIQLSQRNQDSDYGCTDYAVVVTRRALDGSTKELLHTYCTYHSQAGPVRPNPVTSLCIEGSIVKWEWSENAYDLASPGAFFQRPLTLTGTSLAWSGPVVRVPKVRPAPNVSKLPKSAPSLPLKAVMVRKESLEWDKVRINVRHIPTQTTLVWEGTSTAEFQSITGLCTSATNGQVVVEFNYHLSENGSRYCSAMTLVVRSQPTGNGIEWAPK
jgi:hypothetical protein